MKRSFRFSLIKKLLLVSVVLGLAGCLDNSDSTAHQAEPPVTSLAAPTTNNLDMNVYKSPTCGCCGDWVTHVNQAGFATRSYDINNLTQLKADKGLKPEYRSCHTAVSKEGYIFEGHVPAKYIQQFLAEQPEGALGLSVPGRPVGSPGMEMGDRYDSYDVLQINLDGTSLVYAHVKGNH